MSAELFTMQSFQFYSIDMMLFHWRGQRIPVSSRPNQHHAQSISANRACTLSQYEWTSVYWFLLVVFFFCSQKGTSFSKKTTQSTCSWKYAQSQHPQARRSTSATCLTAVSKAVSSSALPLLHKDNITIKCEIKRPFREQWHSLEGCCLPRAEVRSLGLWETTVTGSKATLCFQRATGATVHGANWSKSHVS